MIARFRSFPPITPTGTVPVSGSSNAPPPATDSPCRSSTHGIMCESIVLRCGVNDAAAAEDLTSEVFLEVWKHAGRFEGRSQVSTWLLSIARYKALAALRRRT